MNTIQMYIQTIWASLVALGIIKVAIAVLIIGVLTRVQKILGVIGALLFLAYLLHWI